MKYLKFFESYNNEKWILKLNESLFDKIEDLVKGKSEKGKIIEELLVKNSIPLKGSAYAIHFLGGAKPGKEELSHPFDYLQYTPGSANITEEGLLVLTDEKSKSLMVPDTISFLVPTAKDDIARNWTFGLKPGSSVLKFDYAFDLAKDTPTLTQTKFMYSIPEQRWNKAKDAEVIELDEDIKEISEDDYISFKNPIKMITLQQWVDELNKTGWVKKDKEYFLEYFPLKEKI